MPADLLVPGRLKVSVNHYSSITSASRPVGRIIDNSNQGAIQGMAFGGYNKVEEAAIHIAAAMAGAMAKQLLEPDPGPGVVEAIAQRAWDVAMATCVHAQLNAEQITDAEQQIGQFKANAAKAAAEQMGSGSGLVLAQ